MRSAVAVAVPILLCLVVIVGAIRGRGEGSPGPHSELWGREGERWDPAGRLPDFSCAGYASGDRPIPEVPRSVSVVDFGATPDDESDDLEAFREALAQAEKGAIEIPAGRFILDGILKLDRPGIVLRGAGQGRTELLFPRPLREILGPAPVRRGNGGFWSWGGGLVWLRGEQKGQRLTGVTARSPRGSRRIEVESTAPLRVGMTIRIVQWESDGSLGRHLHAGRDECGPGLREWVEDRLVDWAANVVDLDASSVTLDRPLRTDVRPGWSAEIHSCLPTVHDVGVERLTIRFPAVDYAGHLVEPGYNGIFFESVQDFWIRDVEIVDCDSGVLSYGVSRFGTIENLTLRNPGRPGARSGWAGVITGHHGIALEGPRDILVTGFRIEARFRHDLTLDTLANGNVFSRGHALDLNIDHHRGAPHDNLFSDIDAGPGFRLWLSGGPPEGWGPYAAARLVVWNLRTTRPVRPPPREYPLATLVAVTGTEPERGERWVEPIDPGVLHPRDLHSAQVVRKVGSK